MKRYTFRNNEGQMPVAANGKFGWVPNKLDAVIMGRKNGASHVVTMAQNSSGKWFVEQAEPIEETQMSQEQIHTDNTETLNAALRLIADIREAAGDPEGKLMQDELVRKIRRMRCALEAIVEHKDPSTKHGLAAKIATDALDPLK